MTRQDRVLRALAAGPLQLLPLAAALDNDDPAAVQAACARLMTDDLISSTLARELREGQHRRIATYAITAAGRARLEAPPPAPGPSREPEVLRALVAQGGVDAVAAHLGVCDGRARDLLRRAGVLYPVKANRRRGPAPVVHRRAWTW